MGSLGCPWNYEYHTTAEGEMVYRTVEVSDRDEALHGAVNSVYGISERGALSASLLIIQATAELIIGYLVYKVLVEIWDRWGFLLDGLPFIG